jgi:Ala-tRNA(Pro) deacylase
MRIPDFLVDQRVPFETVVHPPAYTAQRLARYLGVPGRHVAKSVLLTAPAGAYLAVLAAPQQVDLAAVALRLGQPVQLATPEQIDERFGDCEHGALAPFGRLYGLTTLLEESIPLDATIVFESQRHAVAIRMACRDFVRLEQPLRFAFALRTQEPPRPTRLTG